MECVLHEFNHFTFEIDTVLVRTHSRATITLDMVRRHRRFLVPCLGHVGIKVEMLGPVAGRVDIGNIVGDDGLAGPKPPQSLPCRFEIGIY